MTLFDQVRERLMRDWDPIGIKDVPECQDEYDRYAQVVAEMLANGEASGVADYLLHVEVNVIGLHGPERGGPSRAEGARVRVAMVAQKLVELRPAPMSEQLAQEVVDLKMKLAQVRANARVINSMAQPDGWKQSSPEAQERVVQLIVEYSQRILDVIDGKVEPV